MNRCLLFGHDWRFNFPSIPNKRICTGCKRKEKLDLKTLKWKKSTFNGEKRKDDELINKWFY